MQNIDTMNRHKIYRCNTGEIAPQMHWCNSADIYAHIAPVHQYQFKA